jgi:hypothetical protein
MFPDGHLARECRILTNHVPPYSEAEALKAKLWRVDRRPKLYSESSGFRNRVTESGKLVPSAGAKTDSNFLGKVRQSELLIATGPRALQPGAFSAM